MDANLLYRETAVRGASKVGLVVLLYEQIIRDLNKALKAMDNHDVERRTQAINHAIAVIGHLQSTLDLDVKAPVVSELARIYTLVRSRLVEAQARASQSILREQIACLLEVREAWVEVDRAESTPQAHPSMAPAEARIEWDG